MIIAITGRPGVGKSTVFSRAVEGLKARGYIFYGFYCPEIRESGVRIGFRIVDLQSGDFGWLALVLDKAVSLGYSTTGKRIGKYVVIEKEAEAIGVKALRKGVGGNSILGIDEIGPMELSIPSLRREIIWSLERAEKALLVIHRNLSDSDIRRILNLRKTKIYTVTESNRDVLHLEIINELL